MSVIILFCSHVVMPQSLNYNNKYAVETFVRIYHLVLHIHMLVSRVMSPVLLLHDSIPPALTVSVSPAAKRCCWRPDWGLSGQCCQPRQQRPVWEALAWGSVLRGCHGQLLVWQGQVVLDVGAHWGGQLSHAGGLHPGVRESGHAQPEWDHWGNHWPMSDLASRPMDVWNMY